MPAGKHIASGSSFDSRSRETLTAQGCNGSFSPGLRAFERSPMKCGSGAQIPDRSGFPSAARGAGPDDLALSFSRLRMGTPPPAGFTPVGSGWPWAKAGDEQRKKTAPRENAVKLERARSFLTFVSLLLIGRQSGHHL